MTATIKVGPILYSVISALVLIGFVYSFAVSSDTKDERFESFVLGMIALVLSFLLTIVGLVVVAWKTCRAEATTFWLIAAIATALPSTFMFANFAWDLWGVASCFVIVLAFVATLLLTVGPIKRLIRIGRD